MIHEEGCAVFDGPFTSFALAFVRELAEVDQYHAELALVTGDLLVHALQFLHPELAYAHEIDPEAARHSRERMLGRATATNLYLATPHLTEPFLSA